MEVTITFPTSWSWAEIAHWLDRRGIMDGWWNAGFGAQVVWHYCV